MLILAKSQRNKIVNSAHNLLLSLTTLEIYRQRQYFYWLKLATSIQMETRKKAKVLDLESLSIKNAIQGVVKHLKYIIQNKAVISISWKQEVTRNLTTSCTLLNCTFGKKRDDIVFKRYSIELNIYIFKCRLTIYNSYHPYQWK